MMFCSPETRSKAWCQTCYMLTLLLPGTQNWPIGWKDILRRWVCHIKASLKEGWIESLCTKVTNGITSQNLSECCPALYSLFAVLRRLLSAVKITPAKSQRSSLRKVIKLCTPSSIYYVSSSAIIIHWIYLTSIHNSKPDSIWELMPHIIKKRNRANHV